MKKTENFPVACCLFNKKMRKIIACYYNFARHCDNIADSGKLSSQEKLKKLDTEELSLFGKEKSDYATQLREIFVAEQLDFSLITDLLVAFRQDAENKTYITWAQLLDYCKYSAVPVGRFMLAIHNENPSTYLPATALCSVLQIINHIQDLKEDAKNLNRIYIPKELLLQYNVTIKALTASKCSKNLHFLLNEVLDRCCCLLKDAEILPSIIKNMRLRIYVCITIFLSKILIKKLYHTDILVNKVQLTKLDWVVAIIKGTLHGLFTKPKTLTNKGL